MPLDAPVINAALSATSLPSSPGTCHRAAPYCHRRRARHPPSIRPMHVRWAAGAALVAAALVAGCGDDDGGGGEGVASRPASPPADFPAPSGPGLQQFLQQNATTDGPVVSPAARVL